MKNLQVYNDKDDLVALYPPIMRKAPIIQHLCQQIVGQGPVFIATEDRPVERGHFGTYLGCIFDREDYHDQPILHGLYLAHEMMHMLGMSYSDRPFTWHEWFKKMMMGEFMASLFSEVFIYFHIPGLRAASFKHEIWMDRFVPVIYNHPTTYFVEGNAEIPLDAYGRHEVLADRLQVQRHMASIARARRAAMTAPNPYDFLELQIHNYVQSNVGWARVWGDSFREVERHMSGLQRLWNDMKYQDGDVRARMEREHREWLEKHSTDGTPFRPEAEAFLKLYKAAKSLYGNDIMAK